MRQTGQSHHRGMIWGFTKCSYYSRQRFHEFFKKSVYIHQNLVISRSWAACVGTRSVSTCTGDLPLLQLQELLRSSPYNQALVTYRSHESSKESPHLTILGDFTDKHTSCDCQTNYAGILLFQCTLDFGLSQCVDTPRWSPDDFRSCRPLRNETWPNNRRECQWPGPNLRPLLCVGNDC